MSFIIARAKSKILCGAQHRCLALAKCTRLIEEKDGTTWQKWPIYLLLKNFDKCIIHHLLVNIFAVKISKLRCRLL